MADTIAAELAIGMIELLQSYVEDVIECDCDKCPFHNGYHCLLTGCLGQNDAGSLIDNLRNYEQRIKKDTKGD